MLRHNQAGDHMPIGTIFTAAIHEIAAQHDRPRRCRDWPRPSPNRDHGQRRCALKPSFVAVRDGPIVGLLELDADGHINCACVCPARRGSPAPTSRRRSASGGGIGSAFCACRR